jgi:hypothetical protein
MKTNQVRLNRSAARPSPQVKTNRNHKPENVRIVLWNEDGKVFAEFEIPKVMHAAMQRAAQSAGVSLWEWMQSAVREKIASGKPAKNPPAPVNGDDNISLLFFSEREETSIAHVDLTKEQFAAITRHATSAGISLEQSLNNGIMRILAAFEDDGLSELEITHIKVSGLLQLLADKFELLDRLAGTDFIGAHARRFSDEAGLLVSDAQASLKKTFNAVFQAAHPMRPEVAS